MRRSSETESKNKPHYEYGIFDSEGKSIKYEEPRTGRWIRKMDVYRGGYVECSVCGTPYKGIDPKKLKTCTVCHARMEAEI